MKHANSEMIKAVLDNTELAIFCEVVDRDNEDGNYWAVSSLRDLVSCSNRFFVCLPQHKEACLHWLNGGELYINNGKGLGEGNYTLSIDAHNPLADFIGHPEYQFRIKPKKEKRWIAVTKSGNDCIDKLFDSQENAKEFIGAFYPNNLTSDFQFIEIEVEV